MSKPHDVPFETTLHVRDHCLCLAAQRAARALARRFDVALRPIGLTSGQFSLLMSLNRPKPPSIGSVATFLAMDRTTLTANLKPLERRNLVRSVPHETDRRTRLLALTAAGKAALANALELWIKANDRVTRGLGKSEIRALCQTLRRISAESPE